MNKTYDPKAFEERIYSKWLNKKYFHAAPNKNKKPFTIVIPPPNITGQLHIGHALDDTIQDSIIRYKRMKGYEALWLPGTDHASIATEVKIVEKMREEGLDKDSLGRDGFLRRAYEWKDRVRRQNRRTTQKNGVLVRLGSPRFYDGRALLARRTRSFRKLL